MAPPSLAVREFTFTHEVPIDSDGVDTSGGALHPPTRTIPVARITVQVVSFGRRCVWVHLSESRDGGVVPPPMFGPCAVALGGVSSNLTASIIIDDVPLPLMQQQQTSVGAPNPQAVLAQSLAQRLARRLLQECGESVAVYVACGITGEQHTELLGTPSGCSFDVTMRFGAALLRHVMELIRDEVLCTAAPAE